MEKSEKPFLAWFNLLGIEKESVTDIKLFKTGVLLQKLLMAIDPGTFSLEGFSLEAEHWSLCAANLLRLTTGIAKYLQTLINMKIPEDYVDIQAIARNTDKDQILRLCEEVFGIAVNCKDREKYIQYILKLNEESQTILMEISEKYVQKEEVEEGTSQNELVESLVAQLDAKELEKNELATQVKKLKEERNDLTKQLEDQEAEYEKMIKQHKIETDELEELRKKSNDTVQWIAKEKSMEAEIADLKSEIESLQKKATDTEYGKNDEFEKLKEELFISQQKIKKVNATEALLEQQKKKYEELMTANQNMSDEIEKVATLEGKITGLETSKKELEEKNIALINELYSDKSALQNSESELKKTMDENAHLEKEAKRLDEKVKQLDQKNNSLVEKLATIKKEYDSMKISAGAGNLLSQEKEAKYQDEITKLKAQVDRLAEGSGESLKSYALELEDKLKALTTEKQKQGQEIILLNKHQTDLEAENDSLKIKLEYFTKSDGDASEKAKEYQEMKTECKNLQNKLEQSETKLKEMEAQKTEDEKIIKDFESLKAEMEKLKKEKEDSENLVTNLKEANMELEKKFARDEERIALMDEERSKLDSLLQSSSKKIEGDFSSRLSEEVEKAKKELKEKYQAKTKNIKDELAAKQKSFIELEEELRNKDVQITNLTEKLKAEFESEVEEMKEKYKLEKEAAKKALKDQNESSRREERLLASALYEMGSLINKITKEGKPEGSEGNAQIFLGRMAEGFRKDEPGTSGFISSQANARAQSNSKKP